MNIGVCVLKDCQQMTTPGTVFCPGHLAEAQGKAAGVVEPEVEAKARAARSEDDDHPGMRKVYDPDTGVPTWVPVEEAPPRAEAPVRSVPRIYGDDGTVRTANERADDVTSFPEVYVMACLKGEHGALRETIAQALVEGVESALRRL